MILDLLRRYYEPEESGIEFPKDIQHGGTHYDFDTDSFSIKLISKAFAKVDEGYAMPYIDLKLRPKKGTTEVNGRLRS